MQTIIRRPLTWWSLFILDAIAWSVLFWLAVDTYSEGANRPNLLDPAIYILSGLGIVLFAAAIIVTLMKLKNSHVDQNPRVEVMPS